MDCILRFALILGNLEFFPAFKLVSSELDTPVGALFEYCRWERSGDSDLCGKTSNISSGLTGDDKVLGRS